ncbi:type I polyketide synthase [Mycobacteroides abscessus]|uniref:type I polyketide synthase n=1 Tax=Mycobacteroides abscessus TaxID=36809 RepID=UPI0011A3D436|nr:type I polyketide synthase [Mycobacteroides abscessus]
MSRAKRSLDRKIAIVGIGLRLPGARGVAQFWNLLGRQTHAISAAPASRMRYLAAHSSTDPLFASACGTGGFIDDWDMFDNAAFGISMRESEVMDPQQRILLETVFESIVDAGLTLNYLQDRPTGVATGYITRDNWLNARYLDVDALSNVGNTGSGLSGRMSHVFGLTGPAITVDSACSSGLTAVAAAVDNLLLGNCEFAIAAASNLVLDPYETLSFYASGMIASDGLCKFATTQADGFVRSDGFCAVMLRPLEDALAEQDRIYAVIDAVAVGNDGGRSGSLVAPSTAGQIDVIERALALAQREPDQIDYVEAHGTGTVAGDRTELEALAAIQQHRAGEPLPIGSVKTRIGHTEAASGLAGLVVAALAIYHRSAPTMLLHGTIEQRLAESRTLCAHVGQRLVLPADTAAGVSSFGITGTNAHAVLSASPASAQVPRVYPSLPLLASPAVSMPIAEDLVQTEKVKAALAFRVNHSAQRALPAPMVDHPGLLAGLWGERPNVVFAFGGFGSGTLSAAAAKDPVLKEQFELAATAVRSQLPEQQRSQLGDLQELPPELAPFGTWVSQVALANTLQHYGIRPGAVMGHSFGDIAAATVAGALDMHSAAQLLICRTEATRKHAGHAGMVVVSGVAVAENLGWLPDWADLAVINSRDCVVLTCPRTHIDNLCDGAIRRGLETDRLAVTFGSHSRFIAAALPEFSAGIDTMADSRPLRIPMYSSTSTAADQRLEGAIASAHWLENLRDSVDLPAACKTMTRQGIDVVVDIGPRPVLSPHLRTEFGGTVIALSDSSPQINPVTTLVDMLFEAGVPMRPAQPPAWDDELAQTLTWQNRPVSIAPVPPGSTPAVTQIDTPVQAGASHTFVLGAEQISALAGHRVRGETVVPGTATLSYVAKALHRSGKPLTINALRFIEAIVLDETTNYLSVTVVHAGTDVRVYFSTDPDSQQAPILCCTAHVAPTCPTESIELPLDLAPVDVDGFYRAFAAAGNAWTGPFQALTQLWSSGTHAYARTQQQQRLQDVGGGIDPALFDAALHGLAAAAYKLTEGEAVDSAFYFEGAQEITFHTGTLQGQTTSVIALSSQTPEAFNIEILDQDGKSAISCKAVSIRRLDTSGPIRPLYVRWIPLPDAPTVAPQKQPVVIDCSAILGAAHMDFTQTATGADELAASCVHVLTQLGPGRELFVDTRGYAETFAPDRPLSESLALLGQIVTELTERATASDIALGFVIDRFDEHCPVPSQSAAATSRFLSSMVAALPYEYPKAHVVVIESSHRPWNLPRTTIRQLSQIGEYRLQHEADGTLRVARLSEEDHLPRRKPDPSGQLHNPLERSWKALLHPSARERSTAELIWHDPDHGPRSIGTRSLAEDYTTLRGAAGLLWAATAAENICAAAALHADDNLIAGDQSPATRALVAALAAIGIPHTTYPADATSARCGRNVLITVDAADVADTNAIDLVIATGAHANTASGGPPVMSIPALAPTAPWARLAPYNTAQSAVERTLLQSGIMFFTDRAPQRTNTAAQSKSEIALVIGGSGGLGRALCQELRSGSFDRIVATGTRNTPAPIPGADYIQCDITQKQSVEYLATQLGGLDANITVFHLAGIISDGALADLTVSQWAAVLAPKVDGTQHILQLCERLDARQLIVYSSASAVLPSPQFVHYGAANAAMEGIVNTSRIKQCVVRWGFWSTPGMLHTLDSDRTFTPRAVEQISTAKGHAFLWKALSSEDAGLPVCYPADWESFSRLYPAVERDALFRTLCPLDDAQTSPAPTPNVAQKNIERTELEAILMSVLKIEDPAILHHVDRLRALGLDSLLALEVRSRIKSSFGHMIPIQTLLGNISVSQLEAKINQ